MDGRITIKRHLSARSEVALEIKMRDLQIKNIKGFEYVFDPPVYVESKKKWFVWYTDHIELKQELRNVSQ